MENTIWIAFFIFSTGYLILLEEINTLKYLMIVCAIVFIIMLIPDCIIKKPKESKKW